MTLVALNGSHSASSSTHAVAALAAEIHGSGEIIDLVTLDPAGLIGTTPSPDVGGLLAAIDEASILVLVTPIYRATYSGLLKVAVRPAAGRRPEGQGGRAGRDGRRAGPLPRPRHRHARRSSPASTGGRSRPSPTRRRHDFDEAKRPSENVRASLAAALAEAASGSCDERRPPTVDEFAAGAAEWLADAPGARRRRTTAPSARPSTSPPARRWQRLLYECRLRRHPLAGRARRAGPHARAPGGVADRVRQGRRAAGAQHGRARARRRAPSCATARPSSRPSTCRPTLRGDQVWCQLFSEPGAGSDLGGLSTKAERDGDHFVVNGQKVWCSGGRISDWGILMARTNPEAAKHDGISFFLCPMDLPGIEIRPLRQMTGGVRVRRGVLHRRRSCPADRLLGPLHGGWGVGMSVLTNERGHIGTAIISLERRLESFTALGAERQLGAVQRQQLAALIATGDVVQGAGPAPARRGRGHRLDRQLAAEARHLRDVVRRRRRCAPTPPAPTPCSTAPTRSACWPRRPAASPAARARCSATSSASGCSACRGSRRRRSRKPSRSPGARATDHGVRVSPLAVKANTAVSDRHETPFLCPAQRFTRRSHATAAACCTGGRPGRAVRPHLQRGALTHAHEALGPSGHRRRTRADPRRLRRRRRRFHAGHHGGGRGDRRRRPPGPDTTMDHGSMPMDHPWSPSRGSTTASTSMPADVEAGTMFSFKNTSTKEFHEMVAHPHPRHREALGAGADAAHRGRDRRHLRRRDAGVRVASPRPARTACPSSATARSPSPAATP